jgi:3-deoxy-D-manno-octulosonic-acid transferase
MQSELDVKRILAIGAPEDKVKNIGNVKFDDLPEDKIYLPEDFGFERNDTLWIAGSTHPGEEEIVLRVFKNIKTKFPSLRLVIAPRHVERTEDVQRIIEEQGISSVRFSQMKSTKSDPNSVVLVDTIGHLRALYSLATLVFVGKSLTVPGGHNIIEPSFYSKPVIVGPHMQNFRDVMIAFKNDNAVVEVQDPQELESAVDRLLGHPQEMADLGRKAKQVISRQQGAIKRSMEIISHFLDKTL